MHTTAPFNSKLQTSQTVPVTREVDTTISQPEVLVACLLSPTISVYNYYTLCTLQKVLYDAIERGDVSTVRQLVASNVNINCTPYQVHNYDNMSFN